MIIASYDPPVAANDKLIQPRRGSDAAATCSASASDRSVLRGHGQLPGELGWSHDEGISLSFRVGGRQEKNKDNSVATRLQRGVSKT